MERTEIFIRGAKKLVIHGFIDEFREILAFNKARAQAASYGWTSLDEIVKRNNYDMKLTKIK